MAGNQKILVGEQVPLVLQLTDGATDQYPQVEVWDSNHHLLARIDLDHLSRGLYFTEINPFAMPDDLFIKAQYIIYTDALHNNESDIYERDVDIFHRIRPTEFMATGFSVPNEYDAELATIQVDLDNPDQYKADGFAVAGEYDVELAAIQADLDNPDQFKAEVAGLAQSNEYDARLDAIQVDLDTPNQYKADISLVALESTSQSIGAAVGALPTAAEIDTELTGTHGAGSWQEGGGGGATPAEIDAELTANHGVGSWQEATGFATENPPSQNLNDYKATGFATENPPSQNLDDYKAEVTGLATENPPSQNLDDYKADISTLTTEANATVNKNEIIGAVDENEAKIDAIQAAITALNNLSSIDVQSALTDQGYTEIRAVLLDYLDAAISNIPNAVLDEVA